MKNASYTLPDIGEVQLKDGHYEQKYGEGATQVHLVDLQQIGLGDLNNDGIEDAAVVLALNSGGTGVFKFLIIMLNEGGDPRQASSSFLGDRVQINTLDIAQDQIPLNFLGFGPNDSMCCPSQVTIRTYALQDGNLKPLNESSVTATP
jgi:hypothetical protein